MVLKNFIYGLQMTKGEGCRVREITTYSASASGYLVLPHTVVDEVEVVFENKAGKAGALTGVHKAVALAWTL